MLFRFVVLCFVLAAFAKGFAEIVEISDDVGMSRASHPCEEWSNPQCERLPPPIAGVPR